MDYVNDETVIVTGALGGIGAVAAQDLLNNGSTVIGIDQKPDSKNYFANERYRHFTIDITDENSVQEICKEIRAFAKPRHALLIAGGALAEEIDDEDPLGLDIEIFRRSIDINLSGQYICIKHFVPLLESAKDLDPSTTAKDLNRSITLVSSINSIGDFGYPAYSAAKAGLTGLTKSLAVPLGRRHIRINAVAFGTVQTDHARKLHAADHGHFSRLENLAALERVMTSADAARVLISITQLRGLTGTIITADCGQAVPGNHNRLGRGSNCILKYL
jgi:NAD(P)-dependent dehydrogenase (short-subunit alcohol dehydrogenase family)